MNSPLSKSRVVVCYGLLMFASPTTFAVGGLLDFHQLNGVIGFHARSGKKILGKVCLNSYKNQSVIIIFAIAGQVLIPGMLVAISLT